MGYQPPVNSPYFDIFKRAMESKFVGCVLNQVESSCPMIAFCTVTDKGAIRRFWTAHGWVSFYLKGINETPPEDYEAQLDHMDEITVECPLRKKLKMGHPHTIEVAATGLNATVTRIKVLESHVKDGVTIIDKAEVEAIYVINEDSDIDPTH